MIKVFKMPLSVNKLSHISARWRTDICGTYKRTHTHTHTPTKPIPTYYDFIVYILLSSGTGGEWKVGCVQLFLCEQSICFLRQYSPVFTHSLLISLKKSVMIIFHYLYFIHSQIIIRFCSPFICIFILLYLFISLSSSLCSPFTHRLVLPQNPLPSLTTTNTRILVIGGPVAGN